MMPLPLMMTRLTLTINILTMLVDVTESLSAVADTEAQVMHVLLTDTAAHETEH